NELKNLLIYKINRYIRCKDEDKKKEQKAKLDLLVDIEEVILTLARVHEMEPKILVNHAKTSSMEVFKQIARVGKPTLLGCAREFITFDEVEDLIYVETALMQELSKINPDPNFYDKFETKRTNKKSNFGGYKNGNFLHSIEYVNNKEI
ncbi:MAG: hypothetical protein J6Q15_00100, partial [Clostridia bacterium]|nr:hypothetical protein [Clostridia bacterium]